MLRATTACTFWTSQLPKVVHTPSVLYILTCKCASRHNGVQFFISHLASWLRTRRFSEPTFRPSGAPNHWKNTVFRDFPTFSRICIFFLLTLSLLLFFLLIFLFSLPLPSVHIVGSLTSKLPSTKLAQSRSTKLAQNNSQYSFVLPSLHKVLPSTTSYYNACTKPFPVPLRTTKLAQSTSQYYFVLQSLHKAVPSTTSYYEACTKYFPLLLRTTKLVQSTSQH